MLGQRRGVAQVLIQMKMKHLKLNEKYEIL